MATWIVSGILLGLVALTVTYMVKQRHKNKGTNGCAGGCTGCPYAQRQR